MSAGLGSLAARIARRIRREGPISVAAYMAIALHDPSRLLRDAATRSAPPAISSPRRRSARSSAS